MKRRANRGFTYLIALFLVALMAAGYATLGEMWHTASLREKEAELLYVGNQYRKAIERYYLSGPRRYPRTLEELVKDPRAPATVRHIRQLYADPITGSSEWGIVKGPDGGIMGVHSRSEAPPLKTTNFGVRDRELDAATTYMDWKFVFNPAAQTAAKPAATPAPGAAPAPGAPPAPVTPAAPLAPPAPKP
jgi:type II secretory pathway pseudopilin PulG